MRSDSLAARVYLLGGVLMAFVPLLRVWWESAQRQTGGLAGVSASLIVYPTAVALGALGVLLGLAQSGIGLAKPARLVLALLYLVGAVCFLCGLYSGIVNQQGMNLELRVWTTVGLILLSVVLLVHMARFLTSGSASEV